MLAPSDASWSCPHLAMAGDLRAYRARPPAACGRWCSCLSPRPVDPEMERCPQEAAAGPRSIGPAANSALSERQRIICSMTARATDDWEGDRLAFDRLLVALHGESDRGVVLMCLGYVDERMKALVEAAFSAFEGRERACRSLLEFPGPLSTLSSRQRLAYCIGLIGDGEYAAVEALRKIRNHAAHGFEPFSFSDSPTADRLVSILPVQGESSPSDWVRIRQEAGLLPRDAGRHWRFVFVAAIAHLTGALRASIESMRHDGVTMHQIHPSSRMASFIDAVVAERVEEARG